LSQVDRYLCSQTICRPIRINNDPFILYAVRTSVFYPIYLYSKPKNSSVNIHTPATRRQIRTMCTEDGTRMYSSTSNDVPQLRASRLQLLPIQTSSEYINPYVSPTSRTGLRNTKFHRSNTTEKWSKMRTTIYPVSPIDEDARSAINVEFSQLRNTMLLESESDLIQPVEFHTSCSGGISSVKMSTVDILPALIVLHANISSTRRGKSVRWLCLGSGPTHLLLLLETRTILHGLTVQNVDFILLTPCSDERSRDEVTDHMLNTSVRSCL
jgi:hypothetical protein